MALQLTIVLGAEIFALVVKNCKDKR